MSQTFDGVSHKSFWAGLLFIALAVVGYLLLRYSIAHDQGTPIPGDPGPFFLPRLCLTAVGATGAVLTVLGASRMAASARRVSPFAQLDKMARDQIMTIGFIITLCLIPTAMVALGTFYVVAGFSTFWIYAFLVASQGHSVRNIIEAVGLGIATAIFINVVFVRILTLPLPA